MSELRQRAQKYRFWAQTPKDTKIEKSETVIPQVFAISFREKKVYSNRTTRSMRLVGVVQGRHINVSVPVYKYNVFYKIKGNKQRKFQIAIKQLKKNSQTKHQNYSIFEKQKSIFLIEWDFYILKKLFFTIKITISFYIFIRESYEESLPFFLDYPFI